MSDQGPVSPVFVYSLLVATFLGTMGLPHILVRFYTNPDGPAARRTTVRVLGLLALFYAFPAVYGLLGRALLPELYLTGETDSVVLRLPEAAWPGLRRRAARRARRGGGVRRLHVDRLGAARLAGRAPCPSTSGAAARARSSERRRRFRVAALGAIVPPIALALLARGLDISAAGGLGVRAGGEHVLPAAAARDLVGGADRARRGGGPGGRRAGVERG